MNKARSRRDFLAVCASALSASSALPVASVAAGVGEPRVLSPMGSDQRGMTIQDVIDRITAQIPGAPEKDNVIDTVKAGDPSEPVTGVATTFLATSDVIERSAAMGANLIITHEPTYYGHFDQTDWLADDPVYAHKRKLLDRHGIVVWRFHDYWHLHKPDGILTGVLKKLGWEENVASESDRLDLPSTVVIDPTPLSSLADHFRRRLGIDRKLQFVGDPTMTCSRIGLLLGAYGVRSHIQFLRSTELDLLVVGEINEWETSVYIQDARSTGRNTSLLMLGHQVSEEPGMEWLVEWLQPLIPDVPVQHVPTGDPLLMV